MIRLPEWPNCQIVNSRMDQEKHFSCASFSINPFPGFAVATVSEDDETKNLLVLAGETNVIQGSTNQEQTGSNTYFKVSLGSFHYNLTDASNQSIS